MSAYGKSRHALACLDVFGWLARNSARQFGGEVPYGWERVVNQGAQDFADDCLSAIQ